MPELPGEMIRSNSGRGVDFKWAPFRIPSFRFVPCFSGYHPLSWVIQSTHYAGLGASGTLAEAVKQTARVVAASGLPLASGRGRHAHSIISMNVRDSQTYDPASRQP